MSTELPRRSDPAPEIEIRTLIVFSYDTPLLAAQAQQRREASQGVQPIRVGQTPDAAPKAFIGSKGSRWGIPPLRQDHEDYLPCTLLKVGFDHALIILLNGAKALLTSAKRQRQNPAWPLEDDVCR